MPKHSINPISTGKVYIFPRHVLHMTLSRIKYKKNDYDFAESNSVFV